MKVPMIIVIILGIIMTMMIRGCRVKRWGRSSSELISENCKQVGSHLILRWTGSSYTGQKQGSHLLHQKRHHHNQIVHLHRQHHHYRNSHHRHHHYHQRITIIIIPIVNITIANSIIKVIPIANITILTTIITR